MESDGETAQFLFPNLNPNTGRRRSLYGSWLLLNSRICFLDLHSECLPFTDHRAIHAIHSRGLRWAAALSSGWFGSCCYQPWCPFSWHTSMEPVRPCKPLINIETHIITLETCQHIPMWSPWIPDDHIDDHRSANSLFCHVLPFVHRECDRQEGITAFVEPCLVEAMIALCWFKAYVHVRLSKSGCAPFTVVSCSIYLVEFMQ